MQKTTDREGSAAPRAAVDIGGTFTDIVVEWGVRRRVTAKVLTTYPHPEDGFMRGLALALERAGLAPRDLAAIIHGTTLATNALITRRGARTALLATEGFRDVLEIGHEGRFALYDLFIEKPEPLVPRPLRFEVSERIAVDGAVLRPLDEAALAALAPRIRASGAESLALCFLQAWANPAHEERAEAILAPLLPGVTITRAADVCAEIREYDRFSTACANAYIRPLVERYLEGLEAALAESGYRCPLLVVTSGGGMTTPDLARRYPVRLVESGPAGGAVLAAEIAKAASLDRVLSFDMGGTTAKICFITDGEPQHARGFEAARAHRFVKGSGLPLRIPVVEMVEIGAGGGSIARLDALRRVVVGPDSAASDPGPACYGRGGTRPTVTDADLVSGRIDAARFAGGSIALDEGAAQAALADVGGPIGLSPPLAAAAIAEVVEETMSAAARVHAAEGGHDTAGCTMIAFGGAAPLHAARVAEKLGIDRVLVPVGAGVGSAIGFLRAPVSFELSLSWPQPLATLDMAELDARLSAMAARALAAVRAAGDAEVEEDRSALMRYRGQGHEIEVKLPNGRLAEADRAMLAEAFGAAYAKLYGRTIPHLAIEAMTWMLRIRTIPVAPEPLPAPPAAKTAAPGVGERHFLDPLSGREVPIGLVERAALRPGLSAAGPAALLEDETTTLVPVGWSATADAAGNLILMRGAA
jgi:N-methylhydantoinase A